MSVQPAAPGVVDPELSALRDDLAGRLRLLRTLWRDMKPLMPRGASRRYFGLAAMALTGVFLVGGFWLRSSRGRTLVPPSEPADSPHE